ncbi:GGDEF domain-containing protein [Pseudomonas syringae]|uniref:GGDEF domain-containing protein n=1 Tax=Pseudomonas syringae TaxID=317 RepID=UPI0013654703|nr:GGDEF domain-containing protein [Pseudomonas syringae]
MISWLSGAMMNPYTKGLLTWLDLLGLFGMILSLVGSIFAKSFGIWRCFIILFYFFDIFAFKNQLDSLQEQGPDWSLLIAIIINFGAAVLIPVFVDYIFVLAAGWISLCYGDTYSFTSTALSPLFTILVVGVICGGCSINLFFMSALRQLVHLTLDYKSQAFTDVLTQLPNRRALLHEINEACNQKSADCKYFVMIDVDNFKKINDTYGHYIGDETLIALGKNLKLCCDEQSYGRLGGEEFGIIFKESNLQKTIQRIDLLFKLSSEGVPPFSFSAGMVKITRGMEISDVLTQADKQLYLAKFAGKGQLFSNNQLVYINRYSNVIGCGDA